MAPNLDDPDDVLGYLSEPIKAVADGLDYGVSLADSMTSELPFDAHLWSHIVRFGARHHLENLVAGDWQLGRLLRNSGIEIVRHPLVVRVFKSQGGEPPHPGHSNARCSFWTQQQHLPLLFGHLKMPTVSHYLLDWTAGPDKAVVLSLSKPMGIWRYQQWPMLEWRREVSVGQDDGALRFVPADEDLDPIFEDIEEQDEDSEIS